MRGILHRDPPPELVAALPSDHETHVGPFGSRSKTIAKWSRRMRDTDPLPVQIAAMDPLSVFKLIRILMKGKFMTAEDGLRERTSRWIWALLARLPDRGELDYQEIGWIRELGKRAVFMMTDKAQAAALREQIEDDLEASYTEEEGWEAIYDDEGELIYNASMDRDENEPVGASSKPTSELDSGDDGEMDMDLDGGETSSDDDHHAPAAEGTATDLESYKARLLGNLEVPGTSASASVQDTEQEVVEDETKRRHNTYATLTMILTVAGELYGQRDLLDFRDPFPGE